MVSRYFMETSGSARRPPPRSPYRRRRPPSATNVARWRSSLMSVAPAQMRHDPLGVADHLAAEHEHRHAVLPGQRVDLVALGLAPPHAAHLGLDSPPPE